MIRRPGGSRPAEGGSATVEFVLLAVVVLVPTLYLTLAVSRVQAASFATVSAAREASRTFVAASDEGEAAQHAVASARRVLEDFDVEASSTVRFTCSRTPCLTPEGRVAATATVEVPLPLLGGLLDDLIPTTVTIDASATEIVDRFRA